MAVMSSSLGTPRRGMGGYSGIGRPVNKAPDDLMNNGISGPVRIVMENKQWMVPKAQRPIVKLPEETDPGSALRALTICPICWQWACKHLVKKNGRRARALLREWKEQRHD